MEYLIRLFRRETVSTEFIPVIDGLRFLAIAMVVLFHLSPVTTYPNGNFLPFGYQGVQLFFVISGFVLAMPFLQFGLGLTDKRLTLKRYLLRRVTRLEPPYVVSSILCFLLLVVFGSGKIPFDKLATSLAASLLYINNFVFPGELPPLNAVTWSLEIEIQYYLLAPFIVAGICLIKNKIRRRCALMLLMVAFSILAWWIETVVNSPILSLAHYLQYFLGGVLLCEVFLLDANALEKVNNAVAFFVGLLLLIALIGVEHAISPYLLLKIGSPFMVVGFYLIVFGNKWWNWVFSLRPITLIGGMCYTIYLIHVPIIAAVSRLMRAVFAPESSYSNYVFQTLIYLGTVLLISSVFFLLIEKPSMRRNWPSELWVRLRSFGKGRLGKDDAPVKST